MSWLLFILFLCLMDERLMDKTVLACNEFYDYCDASEQNFNPSNQNHPDYYREKNRVKRMSFQPYRRGRDGVLSNQVTMTLDNLLFRSGYDRQIRPGIGGPPLEVEVNVVIRSMGPVDEQNQIFSMDCYFRQYWTDDRLEYNSSMFDELPMNWQFLTKIWRPDTFILNGKDSYLHHMTVPNRFIRISPNGRIAYSQRLTVKARCKMDLRKFPLDAQKCPLEIGSFGNNIDDILYTWSENPLSMDKKLGLAQYHLVEWNNDAFIRKNLNAGGNQNVSIIALNFKFQRRTGFFLLQIYIPLTLIVCCSWVTFWLVKTEKGGEIPARTGLGATTVLAIVTIGFGGKSKPQVGYATALDVFIVMCFFIVFAALVEFACLNFLDTLIRRLKKNDELEELQHIFPTCYGNGGNTDANGRISNNRSSPQHPRHINSRMHLDRLQSIEPIDNDAVLVDECDIIIKSPAQIHWEKIREAVIDKNKFSLDKLVRQLHLEEQRKARRKCKFWNCFICYKSIRTMEIYRNTHKFLYNVDSASRKLFPLTFLLINVFYWVLYVYIL